MAPTATATACLDITFRPDLGILIGRWRRQPTEAELQAGYLALLDEAARHGCRRWLVDTRRRDHANQQHVGWMMAQFLPQLPRRLPGGRVFLAFLFQPNHLRDLETDPTVPALTYFEGRPYQAARFSEELAATDWLLAQLD